LAKDGNAQTAGLASHLCKAIWEGYTQNNHLWQHFVCSCKCHELSDDVLGCKCLSHKHIKEASGLLVGNFSLPFFKEYKERLLASFTGDGVNRIGLATTALGMSVTFSNVRCFLALQEVFLSFINKLGGREEITSLWMFLYITMANSWLTAKMMYALS